MSSDCSLHLSEGLCRDKISSAGQPLKEAGGHMHLEGWMKQPRSEGKHSQPQAQLPMHLTTVTMGTTSDSCPITPPFHLCLNHFSAFQPVIL